ncbi:EutN/CcmL family microcompartment protein [Bacillus piscicola]|uniref:EutN/CcmL family microcompartment protein n=1 Tax=Bacillus piscicola TaxID=1632684 RepID=UPI001F09F65C|nr:EutN/CcmL family microcompartment protein [Bacillus piscicola]
MVVGTVVGNIWATRKEDDLTGLKFLVIEPEPTYAEASSRSRFIAVDRIGAGVGDQVMVTKGTSASFISTEFKLPIDAAVIGIVDSIEVERGDGRV